MAQTNAEYMAERFGISVDDVDFGAIGAEDDVYDLFVLYGYEEEGEELRQQLITESIRG